MEKIKEWTKQSLTEKQYGSELGQMWRNPNRSIPEDVYCRIKWETEIPTRPDDYDSWKRPHVNELLCEKEIGVEPVRILLTGEMGSGKSTALKQIAVGWAEGKIEGLAVYDLMFHVDLSRAAENQGLEDTIVAQNKHLKENGVSTEEVKAALEGDGKVGVLIDGDHERVNPKKPLKINQQILEVLQGKLFPKCFVVATSCEEDWLHSVAPSVSGEAQLSGFHDKETEEYMKKYFDKECNSYSLCCLVGHDPILVHMGCVLLEKEGFVPDSLADTLNAIINLTVGWRAVALAGDEDEIYALESGIETLGDDALWALQKNRYQFKKREFKEVLEEKEILRGLIGESGGNPEVLNFQHAHLQRFLAARSLASKRAHFQVRDMFVTWEEILYLKDVILYACSLTAEPEVIVNFICFTLAQDYIYNGYNNKRGDIKFLSQVRRAIVELFPVDPFHNRHINFVGEQNSRTYNYMHVPSGYYVFDYIYDDDLGDDYEEMWMRGFRADNMVYIKGEEAKAGAEAQVALHVTGDVLGESLKIVKELSKHEFRVNIVDVMIVSVSNIAKYNRREEDSLEEQSLMARGFFETFRLAEDVRSVVFQYNNMSHDMHRYLMREISYKKKLVKLDLNSNSSELPWKLSKTMLGMESLAKLNLANCNMPQNQVEELCLELRRLPLEELNLEENCLRNCLQVLFSAKGFKKMKKLLLKDCALDEADCKALARVVSEGLLPALEELDLTGNSLENCITPLFNGSPLQALKILNLRNTETGPEDGKGLSEAVKAGKLPVLEDLNLRHFNLTDTIQEFLGTDDHPGFCALKKLELSCTDPKDADLVKLGEAIRNHRFPVLVDLQMEHCSLDKMGEEALVSFVQALADTYDRNFKLNADGNRLYNNDELRSKLRDIVKKGIIHARL